MRGYALVAALWAPLALGCGDSEGDGGGGAGASQATGTPSATQSVASATGSGGASSTGITSASSTSTGGMGSWALGQSLTDNWDASDTGWQNGPSAAFSNVQQGATLVLCVYGYTFPNVPFGTPTSSAGQPVVLAVDTGSVGSVQGACWVVHGAAGGSHALSNLPDFTGGDGKLFFAEFRREVGTSTLIYGANTSMVQTFTPPWLDTGTVTMSEAAEPGDLVIAFGLEEEGSQGSPNTQFSDPPAGWQSLGAQQATIQNIGGQASWKNADSSAAQSATWTWSITGGQDPSLFLGGIFAVR